jgi:hypothetical protein
MEVCFQKLGAVKKKQNDAQRDEAPTESLGQTGQMSFSGKQKMIVVERIGLEKCDGR